MENPIILTACLLLTSCTAYTTAGGVYSSTLQLLQTGVYNSVVGNGNQPYSGLSPTHENQNHQQVLNSDFISPGPQAIQYGFRPVATPYGNLSMQSHHGQGPSGAAGYGGIGFKRPDIGLEASGPDEFTDFSSNRINFKRNTYKREAEPVLANGIQEQDDLEQNNEYSYSALTKETGKSINIWVPAADQSKDESRTDEESTSFPLRSNKEKREKRDLKRDTASGTTDNLSTNTNNIFHRDETSNITFTHLDVQIPTKHANKTFEKVKIGNLLKGAEVSNTSIFEAAEDFVDAAVFGTMDLISTVTDIGKSFFYNLHSSVANFANNTLSIASKPLVEKIMKKVTVNNNSLSFIIQKRNGENNKAYAASKETNPVAVTKNITISSSSLNTTSARFKFSDINLRNISSSKERAGLLKKATSFVKNILQDMSSNINRRLQSS